MARESFYIRNDKGFGSCPACAANPSPFFYARARNRSLEWSKNKLILLHQIKTNPEPPELLFQCSYYVCQVCNKVRLCLNQCFYMRDDGMIVFFLRSTNNF